MRFEVEIGANGLRSLFKIADIDKTKVTLKPLNRKDGFNFKLEGKDAENFEYVIRNTDVPYRIDKK